MKGNTWDRAIRLAEYIVETKNTVRKTAMTFGVSKSTVHTGVTKWNGDRDYMKITITIIREPQYCKKHKKKLPPW